MNTLVIEKQTGGYFKFTLNGDTANAITSIQNDLLAVGTQLHFKTGNGANIIKEQFIYPADVTIIASGTFTFSTVAQVWDKLIDIDYFAWLGGGGTGGVDRFDDLLDTFSYTGNAGKAVVVDGSELRLVPITLYNKRLFTELEDTPSSLVPNKMLVVNPAGTAVVLQDQPEQPEQLLNSVGYFDYNDLATQTTPLNVIPNVALKLTNDTEGANTSTDQNPYGVSYVWDYTTNQFNFNELEVGDTIDVRIHVKITTNIANQKVLLSAKFGIGSVSEFTNIIYENQFKPVGLHDVNFVAPFYMGSTDITDYPAELYLTTDSSATVKVEGWYVRILRKNINIITVDYTVPDATSSVKGIVRLAGDLAGTANSPTVPELANKVPNTRTVSTTSPLLGGGALSSNLTLSIQQANSVDSGYLSNVDWSTFNAKANDNSVVHLAGTETITGAKTFTDSRTTFQNADFAQIRFKNTTDLTKYLDIGYGSNGNMFSTTGLDFRVGGLTTAALSIASNENATFKENLTAKSFIKSGGTSSQFLKADGSVDSTTYALDSAVVKLTGDQSIAGKKTFDSSVGSSDAIEIISNSTGYGIKLSHPSGGTAIFIDNPVGVGLNVNNTGTNSFGMSISNPSTGRGISITNGSTGTGIYNSNGNTGNGIYSNNSSTGVGFYSNNVSTGQGIYSQNNAGGWGIFSNNASTGRGINSVNASTGTGFYSTNSSGGTGIESYNSSTGKGIYSGNSSTGFGIWADNSSTGIGIYSSNTGGTGSVGIRSDNSSTGSGIRSDNTAGGTGITSVNSSTGKGIGSTNTSTGEGIYSNNTLTGTGIYSDNGSTGIGIYSNNKSSGRNLLLNNTTAATGMPFTIQKQGADKFTINDSGEATGTKFNSGGTSGQFVKGDGSLDGVAYASDSAVVKLSGDQTITGTKTFNVTSATDAILVNNSGGRGLRILNETGSLFGLIINNSLTATATPFAIQKSGATVFSISDAGLAIASNGTLVGGTGTTNYIPKFTGASAIGSSAIYDNSGNIGIGITSSNQKLAVVALNSTPTLAGNQGSFSVLQGAADYGIVMGTKSSGNGWVQVKRVDGTATAYDLELQPLGGNVGIGTPSPSVKLESSGAVKANTNAFGAEGGFIINYSGSTSSRTWRLGSDLNAFGDFSIQQSTTQTGSTYTDRLYINASGNVGIGTTSPAAKLQVFSDRYNDSLTFNAAAGFIIGGSIRQLSINTDDTSPFGIGFQGKTNGNTAANIYFQSLGGNVGIGTPSPSTNLHIKHSGAYAGIIVDNTGTTGGGGLSLYRNGSQIGYVGVLGSLLGSTASDLAIFSETGKNIQFFTDGTTTPKAIITSSGNVGIGTTSPIDFGSTFKVLTTSGSTGSFVLTSNSANTIIGQMGVDDTLVYYGSRTNHPVTFSTNTFERMRITSGGNVEIKNSDSRLYGGDNVGRFIIGNPTVTTYLAIYGNTHATVPHLAQFIVNNSAVLNMTGSGNVGIGTTSPGEKLSVSGNIGAGSFISNVTNNYGFILNRSATNTYNGMSLQTAGTPKWFIGMRENLSSNDYIIYSEESVGNVFELNGASKAATFRGTVTAFAFIPTSDIRLKDLTDYNYNVELIKPITYTWKDSEDKRKKIGYSAQQVQKFLPEVVNTDDKGMLSVDYNQIFVAKIDMLQNMIQELKAEIEILKNK